MLVTDSSSFLALKNMLNFLGFWLGYNTNKLVVIKRKFANNCIKFKFMDFINEG